MHVYTTEEAQRYSTGHFVNLKLTQVGVLTRILGEPAREQVFTFPKIHTCYK